MLVVQDAWDSTDLPRGVVATIGNFDGIHRGQRAILDQAVGRAREIGATAAMVTFDPHPLKVLRPREAPPLLTTAAQKERLVEGTGIDVLYIAAALSLAVGRDVHVVRLDDASIPLLEEIIDHGVVVHEGRPGSGASWRSHALADLELDRPWYALQRDAWLKRVAAEGI